MKILTENSGKNKHGQALARVQCSCGNIFEPIFNNVKSGRTKTCGHCNKPDRIITAEPVAEKTQEVESTFERGSLAWIDDEINRKTAALISNENHIRFMELEIAAQDSTNLDTLKKRKAESGSANDLRHEIAALALEKAQAETGAVKSEKSKADIIKDRIASLKK